MTLENQFIATVQKIKKNQLKVDYSLSEVFACVDLTRLDEQASSVEICALAALAEQQNVAAICVYPKHLDLIASSSHFKRATVVNFPTGEEPHEHVLRTIEQAIVQHQADEIDYVFPFQTYLSGQNIHALNLCHEAQQLCQRNNRVFKVILETGALPSIEVIHQLSIEIIERGCDFIKTSTGKIGIGATLPAAFAMLSAINATGNTCGIKISGGIKTMEQANSYIELAEQMLDKKINHHWFRIGASALPKL